MKRWEFIEVELPALLKRLQELSGTKGSEYAGDDELLANFIEDAKELELQPSTVLHIFLNKHLRAIRTHVSDRQSGHQRLLSEPIEGRIDDAILYLALLRVMIRGKNND